MFGSDRVTPEVLLGLGNLARGNNWGEQVANAGTGVLAATTAAKEKAVQEEAKNKTAELLQVEAPDLAVAVRTGALTATDAYRQHLERKAKAEEAARPKRSFQKLDDGTYGFADENAGTFDRLGQVEKPMDLPASVQEYEFARKTQGFTGTLQDWQERKAKLDDGKPSEKFKTELDTMKSYRGEDPVKTFQATRDGYEKVRTSAELATAQGDMGIIFGFMKMLDPTSVVREGEQASAQNSGGVPDMVINWYNRARDGQRLSPSQRKQFIEAAEAQYQNSLKNLQDVNDRYTGLADEYGVPTERFLERPKEYPPLKIGGEPTSIKLNDGTEGTIRRTK